MNKKYLECLQMNISNECLQMNIVIAKNVNITSIFDQRNSFNNLIHSSSSSTFESPQKIIGIRFS